MEGWEKAEPNAPGGALLEGQMEQWEIPARWKGEINSLGGWWSIWTGGWTLNEQYLMLKGFYFASYCFFGPSDQHTPCWQGAPDVWWAGYAGTAGNSSLIQDSVSLCLLCRWWVPVIWGFNVFFVCATVFWRGFWSSQAKLHGVSWWLVLCNAIQAEPGPSVKQMAAYWAAVSRSWVFTRPL